MLRDHQGYPSSAESKHAALGSNWDLVVARQKAQSCVSWLLVPPSTFVTIIPGKLAMKPQLWVLVELFVCICSGKGDTEACLQVESKQAASGTWHQ